MIQKQLRDFLAKTQQIMRQKDRFGDIRSSVVIKPKKEELAFVEDIITKFIDDPEENVDLLLKNCGYLEYISEDFVEQLSQTNFYINLTNLIVDNEQAYKAFYIIAGAISQISNFTNSFFRQITIDRDTLLSKYVDKFFIIDEYNDNKTKKILNRDLSFFQIIDELMTVVPGNADYIDLIVALEECISKILSIQDDHMKNILSNWGITEITQRRIYKNAGIQIIFHRSIRLLIQIVENPYVKAAKAISFAQDMVLTKTFCYNDQYGFTHEISDSDMEKMICDSLFLLSKICFHLGRLTASFANNPLIDRLIYLLANGSLEIKSHTLNAINQICCGMFNKPVIMLIDKGLLELLTSFIQEYPEKADQAFCVAYSICLFGVDYVEKICESGFVDLIISAVDEGTYDVQCSAIYLVSNILFYGNFESIRKIINTQIFNTMIEIIEEDCSYISCILNGIHRGLESEHESLDTTLKDFLTNQDFVSLLQSLTESEDSNTSELAYSIYQYISTDSED